MLRALIVIGIASGVLVWLTSSPARYALTAGVSLSDPTASYTGVQPASSAATPIVRLGSAPEQSQWLSGTILLDDERGSPGIPYLAYTDETGGLRTKQLVFASGRGCRPDAGDLPCAPTTVGTYPQFPAGTVVRAYGAIDADRFVVERIERTNALY